MLVFFFWSAKRILPKREWEGEMGREAGRRAEGAKREGERGEEENCHLMTLTVSICIYKEK